MLLLPITHLAQHFFDRFFVADEVVVDDECNLEARGA